MIRRTVLWGLCLSLCGALGELSAQNYSLSTNVPALVLGDINLNPSVAVGKKLSVELNLAARPFQFGLPMPSGLIQTIYEGKNLGFTDRMKWSTVKHMRLASASPGVRYWMKGTYNRGFFFGVHALGMIYEYGSDGFDSNYSKGYLVGGGASAGYSYELAPRWNVEAEVGVAGVWAKYDRYTSNDHRLQQDKSRTLIMPSRLALRLVYLF